MKNDLSILGDSNIRLYINRNGKEKENIDVSGKSIYEILNMIHTEIQKDLNDDSIVFNQFGIEEKMEDGEWLEWLSSGGDDIMGIYNQVFDAI